MHFLLLLIRHMRAPEERDALLGVIERSLEAKHREEVETMVVTDAMVLREEGRREVLRDFLLQVTLMKLH